MLAQAILAQDASCKVDFHRGRHGVLSGSSSTRAVEHLDARAEGGSAQISLGPEWHLSPMAEAQSSKRGPRDPKQGPRESQREDPHSDPTF